MVVVADAVGVDVSGGGEGSHHGEGRIRILETSTHEGFHGFCRCRCSPCVRVRHIWKRDAIIVNGARWEGTSGERRRVRIDKGSKGVIVQVACSDGYFRGVRVRYSWKSDAVLVSGAGIEGTFGERQRVRIDEGSKRIVVRMAYGCRWCPAVGIRCNWESDAVIVSGACGIGTSGERRRVRVCKGSRGVTVRMGTIARRSKSLIRIVVTVSDMADTVVFGKHWRIITVYYPRGATVAL